MAGARAGVATIQGQPADHSTRRTSAAVAPMGFTMGMVTLGRVQTQLTTDWRLDSTSLNTQDVSLRLATADDIDLITLFTTLVKMFGRQSIN
jgi:hypothetical protein